MDTDDTDDGADTSAAAPSRGPSRRTIVRGVVGLVVLGLAVHLLLPQVDQVGQTLHSLSDARPLFIVLAVVASVLSYAGTSLSLVSAAPRHLPPRRAAQSALAASALQAITPANIGTFALYGAVLRSSGATVAEAATGVAANAMAPIVVGIVLLVVAALLIGQVPHPQVHLPTHFGALAAVLFVLVAAGLVVIVWWCRRRGIGRRAVAERLRRSAVEVWAQLRQLADEPSRAAGLLGGGALTTLSYVACLFFSVHAFGGRTDLVSATFVYVVATAVAAVAPTPGGLGAVETAMVSGLTLFGGASGAAVAGVLLYRLATFWLPIPFGAVMLRRLRRQGVR